jgi:hypothetical protein
VEDALDAFAGVCHRRSIAKVRLGEFEAAWRWLKRRSGLLVFAQSRGKVGTSPGFEVIQPAYAMAIAQQSIDKVRSDEAGRAGHKVQRHRSSVSPDGRRYGCLR